MSLPSIKGRRLPGVMDGGFPAATPALGEVRTPAFAPVLSSQLELITHVYGVGGGGHHQVTQKPHPGNRGAVRFCTERKINANGINKVLFGTLGDS